MTHTDKIIRDLEFVHEGVFDFKDFLQLLKAFFKRYNYDVDEKLYDNKIKNGMRNLKIKWTCDRKVDDYNKCIIKLTLDLKDGKEGVVDGLKVVDGQLKVTYNAEIERDYDEKWKVAPAKRFLRSLYDKYVSGIKQSKIDTGLKDLVETLKKEVKQYFKA